MTMTAIPALDRTSATFKADVDTFFTSRIPTFVTEANALQADVVAKQLLAAGSATSASTDAGTATTKADEAATSATNALTQAELAAASANSAINSPGTSATSATSLTIGSGLKTLTIQTGKALVVGQFLMCANPSAPVNYMVGQIAAYNSGTGALTLNVTSSGGAGTYASWNLALTPAGSGASNGGADVTTSAADITLLASSGRMQAVTMTTPGKSIFLPDATSLSMGGAIFILTNRGAYSFYARKFSGSGVVKVPPNSSALLYLSDNTTVDGVWSAGLLTQATALALGTILVMNSVASNAFNAITALSATSALICWREGTTLKVCVLTVSGLSVVAGPALTVDTATYACGAVALSSTQALLVFAGIPGPSRATVLTVTGSGASATVTNGALAVIHATKGYVFSLALLSPTSIAMVLVGTGDINTCCILTVSGNTVSPGAELWLQGTYVGNFRIHPIDSSHFVYVYQSTALFAAVVTVTGGAIAAGTPGTLVASNQSQPYAITLLGNGAVVAVVTMVASVVSVATGNINGSVVTTGSVTQVAAENVGGAPGASITAISTTQAVLTYANGTTNTKTALARLSDGALSTTVPTVLSTNVADIQANCALSTTRCLVAFPGTSNYLQSAIMEVL